MAGSSADVAALDELLAVCERRKLSLRRVRLGDLECEFAPTPLSVVSFGADESGHLSPADEERAAREEYETLQYGASEGPDYS